MFFSTSSRARRWRAVAATVGAAALILFSGAAVADTIHRDTTVGASGPTTITLSGGSASTTMKYFVNASSGCDISSTASVWHVNIAGAAGVTANPANISFTTCETDFPVTFTATSAGSRAVTLSYVSGPTLGSNPENPAAFTLTVNVPSNTAPHVSVGGVTNGSSYEFGSVPAASCTVTDAEDASPSATPTLSAITGPFSSYGLGSRTATCSYTDGGGLTDSASVTYSIVDTTQPTLNTPGSQSLEATGPSGATATWSGPTGSDNVALAAGSPSCDVTSPHTFALGVHTVNCSATDVAGNSRTGSFTVTVTDTTGPSVTAPNDVTEEAADSSGAIVAYSGATASDVHDGSLTPTCAPASGSVFALGDTTVTCTATDSSGNTGSATFHVFVVDTTPPHVSVPADIDLEATSPSGAPATFTVTAMDTVDGATSVTCDHDSGDTFDFGETTVSCSSTDAHSNTGHESFTVTVADTTPPVLESHGDETAEATGPTGAVVSYTKPGATDVASTTVQVDCIPESDTTFALATTPVNCTATDAHGNHAYSSFDVTVQDTTPPAITVPADKTAEATGPSGAAVTFTATASDLVDGSTLVECTPASGSTFALGDTTVDCSSTDAHANTDHASFKVSVVDTTAPTLHLPSDITRSATSASGAVVSYTATADDLVDSSVTPSCTPSSGSTFGPGTTAVSCSATDDSGNTSTGGFNVTVNFGWNGFFAPVDNNGVLNAIKGGQSVPLKWNIPNGSGGWISSLDVVSSVRQSIFTCTAGAPTDDVEAPTSGLTSLRYDSTANQYIYNWQSPKTSNTCYKITVNLTDGSSRSALFKTK
jgi:hypothetical protein